MGEAIGGCCRMEHLWPRKLFLSVIPEVTENDNDLTRQRDPERYRREWTVLQPVPDIPQTEIGEHQLWGDGRSGHDDNDRAQHLGEGQSRADMETREGLEEDHAQTNTLDGIEDPQPEPQRKTDPGSSTSRPWNVQSDGGDAPEHLAPTRRTDTNCEDGKEPRMDRGDPDEE